LGCAGCGDLVGRPIVDADDGEMAGVGEISSSTRRCV